MADCLPALELNPPVAAKASVIWLHGLGADGYDFEGIVPDLNLPESLAVRFIFPHAPEKSITINRGMVMRAWFDILEPGQERAINVGQLLVSTAEVHKLIDREIGRGIDCERIILAGFSQGGAVCYQAALTYDKPLAGVAALSAWFPTAEAVEMHPANNGLPVAVFHGTQDPVIGLWMAENSVRYLEKLGLHPSFHTFSMGHAVCMEEIRMVARFIRTNI